MQWSEGRGRGQRRSAAIARAPAAAIADGRTEIGCPRSCTTFKMPIDQDREGGGALTLAPAEGGRRNGSSNAAGGLGRPIGATNEPPLLGPSLLPSAPAR